MMLLMILSWIFIIFVFAGFLYLIFSWVLAKDADYVFNNNKDKLFLIIRRFSFIIFLIGVIVLFISSLNTLSDSSSGELQEYTPGEEIPWK